METTNASAATGVTHGVATINIRTAHGYLSIQPSGVIEFRPEPGAWETFIVEGVGLPAISPPSVPSAGPTWPPSGSEVALNDMIDLSRARIASRDCPDVRHWPVRAPLTLVEFAATERFERGDTMVDFPGRDALPAAIGSQGPIAYTLWMGCRIPMPGIAGGGGDPDTWYIAPIVECIRSYVPTGRLLAPGQVATNLLYYPDPPLRGYQPKPGEQIALFCTTGDTRRQNAQVLSEPWRTNVVLVQFSVGRHATDQATESHK